MKIKIMFQLTIKVKLLINRTNKCYYIKGNKIFKDIQLTQQDYPI